VTYTLQASGGDWDAVDNGAYSIAVNANEVFDAAVTGANAVAAGMLGVFNVAVAEIDVTGNGVSIVDGDVTPEPGDHTVFGEVVVGQDFARTFTISNTGLASIDITSPASVTGAGFEIAEQPAITSLGASQSTTFEVRFTANMEGPSSGIVVIENNDGNEAPYSFAVNASGVVPEIDVSGNGRSVASGDDTPARNDNTDFGNIAVGTTASHVFTVSNVGSGTIHLTGPVSIFGAGFNVTQPADTALGAGESTTFLISVSPAAPGSITGLITIASDDADENPYTFAVAANGVDAPPLEDMIFTDSFE